MSYMSVTADQMACAACHLRENWGDYGYRFTGIESRTYAVAVFRVRCSDGSEFSIVADKWGNTRHLDTHSGDDGLHELVMEMHDKATAA